MSVGSAWSVPPSARLHLAVPATLPHHPAMCDATLFGICLQRPEAGQTNIVFGFAQFVEALALLLLVFNLADPRARFRAMVAPVPLLRLTFVSIAVIGAGTLLTDLWIDERWPALTWGWTRVEIQSVFGLYFLALILIWAWFSYLRPPVFGRMNHKRFVAELYRVTVRSADNELPIVLSEVVRSAPALVKAATLVPSRKPTPHEPDPPAIAISARDALLAMGSRKVCRQVAASTPELAIVAMSAAAEVIRQPSGRSGPTGLAQFARNVSLEAVLNTDSVLYHEDSGFQSGLLGYMRPFSTSMYGDFRLVETLGAGHISPLDLDYQFFWSCTPDQFERYCRIALMTAKAYVDLGTHEHSFVLHRAFSHLEHGVDQLYRLNGLEAGLIDAPEWEKLRSVMQFVHDLVEHIDAAPGYPLGRVRRRNPNLPPGHGDEDGLIDQIANLLFTVVEAASAVRAPADLAWTLQNNSVWSKIFGPNQCSAWTVIQAKLLRHLYEEVKELETLPNYRSAKILAFCLHVLGLRSDRGVSYERRWAPFRLAILGWTKRHYLALRAATNDSVAEVTLAGNITFDAKRGELVQTGILALHKAPPRIVLKLDKPPRRSRVSKTAGP